MAINETVLGPNSSLFVYSATETTATVMAAMDAYITSHGWTLYDAAAPIAASGYPIGRVWRALQDGSTTAYKYVQIALATTGLTLKVFESWNATTHVGTNDASFSAQSAGNPITMHLGTEGGGFVLFVNQKWLAIRSRANTLVHSQMLGAFEIKKEFGEDPSFPSVIYMNSSYTITNAGNSVGVGFFGSPRTVAKNLVGQSAANVNSISTLFGTLGCVSGASYQVSLNNMLPQTIPNGTCTMTAVENNSVSQYGIEKIRGRIFGVKLVYGAQVWNDMDLAQVKCDAELFQQSTGSVVNHHIVNQQQNSYPRFVLPV